MYGRVLQEPGRSGYLHGNVETAEQSASERSGGSRKSERLVIPVKRGNPPEGPRGGKGAPDHGTVGGKDEGDIELYNRLNET
jgi:hypothetical protein